MNLNGRVVLAKYQRCAVSLNGWGQRCGALLDWWRGTGGSGGQGDDPAVDGAGVDPGEGGRGKGHPREVQRKEGNKGGVKGCEFEVALEWKEEGQEEGGGGGE